MHRKALAHIENNQPELPSIGPLGAPAEQGTKANKPTARPGVPRGNSNQTPPTSPANTSGHGGEACCQTETGRAASQSSGIIVQPSRRSASEPMGSNGIAA